MTDTANSDSPVENPFFAAWGSPVALPPFERIRPEHFRPAFDRALALHRDEVQAVANDPTEPSFDNTILLLEKAGRALARVEGVFHVLAGAHTNDDLLALERDMSPVLAKHWSAINLDAGLFRRVDDLYRRREGLGLDPEQLRVLERYHLNFSRTGAGLGENEKARLAAITERLATLGTAFGQNVLADERSYALVLDGEEDLAGLPEFLCQAAGAAAEERGFPGKQVITLLRSSIEPFLTFSTRRDLREKAFAAWIARGEGGGATDNRAIISEMVALRAERARILGYPTYAHFRLEDSMAKTPAAARGLLDTVWAPAKSRAAADRDALQALVGEEGGNFKLAPWDWRHYAEKLRKARYDLNEAEIKPYLQLDRIIEAAFDTAHKLFGLTFAERHDVPVFHPDIRVWEVHSAAGRYLGLFFGDYFARASKHSGAWMTTIGDQEKITGDVRPLVFNVMNFAKAADGEPTLLSLDDARTLFHEFGHALHGLMSEVTYPTVAGTNVLRDFVELPSQLYEHWLDRPEVLRKFAVHYETGAPMPDDLLARMRKARNFGRAFATVEYLGSAMIDLDVHLLPSAGELDIDRFEAEMRERVEMPEEIVLRHRPPHFQHIFAGEGYSAAYYSYMWSEVLDADAFAAFEETGDVFDAATARRLADNILSVGGSREPSAAYIAFRGRLPSAEPLLHQRGLL